MTEADAEQQEPPRGERDALDVALGSIGKNRDGGNDTDTEGPQRHEETVPVVRHGKRDEQQPDHYRRAHHLFAKQPGRARELAIAQDAQHGDCGNGRSGAEQHRQKHQRG